MTAFQHNKLLGVFHLVYGGATTLVLTSLLFLMFGLIAANPNGGSSVGVVELILIFAVFMGFLLTATSILAGYAFLKRKSWAKRMGVLAAIVAALNFPVGSALCVYTLWFLFGQSRSSLYQEAAYALPAEPPIWNKAVNQNREREYVPPSRPPDWR
ncbi:MAG TPA: hypothetical protein VFH31_12855 [Pyrinomonadaceae bacterium]|nr:hypothetical protein [Pyrinomonadaceae bacterium]